MIEQEPFCAKHSLTMLLVLNAAALSLDFVFWVHCRPDDAGQLSAIMQVRAINTMKGFDWFVSQVLYPMSVASVLCPIVLGMKALGQISPRDTGFPLKYFFMLACLGTAQNWGLTVGGTLISGPMQIILGKVPMSGRTSSAEVYLSCMLVDRVSVDNVKYTMLKSLIPPQSVVTGTPVSIRLIHMPED